VPSHSMGSISHSTRVEACQLLHCCFNWPIGIDEVRQLEHQNCVVFVTTLAISRHVSFESDRRSPVSDRLQNNAPEQTTVATVAAARNGTSGVSR